MRQGNKLIYSLFISIGIILLLVSFIFNNAVKSQLLGDVTRDIGVVVLSLVLVDMLWKFTGGEPISEQIRELLTINKFNAQAVDNGLVGIYTRATDISSAEWLELIRNSKAHIDMSSHTQSQFINEPHLWQELVNRAKSGVKVRLLLNSPDNSAVRYSGYSPPEYLESMHKLMENAWKVFQSTLAALPPDKKENLTIVRLSEETLFISIRRFDEKMIVTQYLYSDNMRNSPSFVIEGSNKPLFKKYLNEFEHTLSRNQNSQKA